ncbi:Chloride channel core [Candidatus Zixiibacteriota bacterium]|nr:Chloride channel core [candidate division Zixibacteria bacterium]
MGLKTTENEDNLADFSRDRRMLILSAAAPLIGAIGALVAYVLVRLIALITNGAYFQIYSGIFRSPDHNHLGPIAIFIPVAGGLIIGLMARYGSERIRGHGIPEALEAILFSGSRMEAKVAVLKPLSSAISIGTGGPFGAEGPIIMTGGAFGSLFGQMFHFSANERKTLLVAGAAAGMSAIFASPVAAVLLAVELLLFEWRPRSIVPVALASITAYALRVPLLGSGPIFAVKEYGLPGAEILMYALLVGIIAGTASGLLTKLVYLCEDLFDRIPLHWMWWPAIGGLAVGLGGLIEPRILGVGYDTIHALLLGNIVGLAAIIILLMKTAVWSISLGSGTSGGVLAPLLMIGGALGAAETGLIPVGDTGLWVIISMAATMGGTMRSPLTAMIFAVELTGQMNLLPALLAGCFAAHGVTVLLMRRSILTEKVARRGYHITREYEVDPLAVIRVREVMDPHPAALPAEMTVTELSNRIARYDPAVGRHQGWPIAGENGRLVGIVTRSDIMRILSQDKKGAVTLGEAGRRRLIVAYPDEPLRDAVNRLLEHDIGRLPVVDRDDPDRLIGYLGRPNVIKARLRQLQEERHDRKFPPMTTIPQTVSDPTVRPQEKNPSQLKSSRL